MGRMLKKKEMKEKVVVGDRYEMGGRRVLGPRPSRRGPDHPERPVTTPLEPCLEHEQRLQPGRWCWYFVTYTTLGAAGETAAVGDAAVYLFDAVSRP